MSHRPCGRADACGYEIHPIQPEPDKGRLFHVGQLQGGRRAPVPAFQPADRPTRNALRFPLYGSVAVIVDSQFAKNARVLVERIFFVFLRFVFE